MNRPTLVEEPLTYIINLVFTGEIIPVIGVVLMFFGSIKLLMIRMRYGSIPNKKRWKLVSKNRKIAYIGFFFVLGWLIWLFVSALINSPRYC